MSTVAVLAGGSPHAHDFDAIRDALVELVVDAGHVALAHSSPDEVSLQLDAADALVVDGLWWRMLGDAYEPWREQYAYSPPPATRERLSSFVAAGGGLVALHTTPICFDDWPAWGDVVGASWTWGRSSHPPYGAVTAHVAPGQADHPIVAGVPATFGIDDEVYGDLDLRDGITPLVTARRHADDADQPIVFTHLHHRGRVAYDCFGHDAASIRHPVNRRIVTQALDWVLAAPVPEGSP